MIRAWAAGLALLLVGACDHRAPLSPLDQTRRELAVGDPVGAQIALNKLLDAGAPRAEVAALMGEAALLEGDLIKARAWLGPGQFSEPTRAHGFQMLGRLEFAEGNLAASGKAYDAALAFERDNPELWVDIGRLRYRGGEQEQAIAAARQAVALGPGSAAALRFRGQLTRDAAGLVPAARWFAKALEKQPGNAELRADYAATLGDAGRATDALAVLRGGESAGPALPRILYIQAVLAARGGDYGLARSLLQRSGKAERGVPAALMLSALIDVAQENFASAAQTLDRLSGMQPDNLRVNELLAHALSRSGGEAELIQRFGARALRQGGSPYLRLVVGRALEAVGDRAAAAQYLDLAARPDAGLSVLPAESIGADDGSGPALRDDIRTALALADFGHALESAEVFVRRLPGSGDALAQLGDVRLAMGDRAGARAAYAESARIRQPWPMTLRMLMAQRSPSDGARLLADYLRANPMNGEAAVLLADAYAANHDWVRALVLLDHAIANGQGRVPYVLAARSVAAARNGDTRGALEFALQAHELQPLNAAATTALIAALPKEELEARAELEQKLRSLRAR